MHKEHKCLGCGDVYTEADLRRLMGFNEPYLLLRGKGGKFLCPTCYEDFCLLSAEEQDEMLERKGRRKNED